MIFSVPIEIQRFVAASMRFSGGALLVHFSGALVRTTKYYYFLSGFFACFHCCRP